ncbi:protein translocase subunit SecF [Patescibacteria group bacterium]
MIRFSKFLRLYFLISAMVLIPGVISLLVNGLKPAVDFTGGTLLELQFLDAIEHSQIDTVAQETTIEITNMQPSENNTFLFRMKPTERENISNFINGFSDNLEGAPQVIRNETVGPILGKELLSKTVMAAFFAVIVILLFVAYAFKNIIFGISAIIALLHDVMVTVGIFSLLGYFLHVEVDTLFVTAVLTTMSFSVHDTIVVFDRIRELSKRGSRMSFEDRCDTALTETMNRSVVNSLTIIFMLLALVLMGGETIRWFVVALLIGTISGTYSSPFVATPSLILLHRRKQKKK